VVRQGKKNVLEGRREREKKREGNRPNTSFYQKLIPLMNKPSDVMIYKAEPS
jgi:hypothetical protein